MAYEFSVPSHTIFFAGYLDAVGRHYTDETRLCALTATVMPSVILDGLTIRTATPVDNLVREFDRDISRFLNADSKNRLVFYLIEYLRWYQDFSETFECEQLQLDGGGLPHDHLAYRLLVDHKHEVLFLAYWKSKETISNEPPQSM